MAKRKGGKGEEGEGKRRGRMGGGREGDKEKGIEQDQRGK